jgi:hypothetical protein
VLSCRDRGRQPPLWPQADYVYGAQDTVHARAVGVALTQRTGNLLKNYLHHQGIVGIIGKRDTTCLACQNDLTSDGEEWMVMSKVRNQSSYTYNHEQSQAIAPDVIERFAPMIAPLRQRAAASSAASSKEQFSNSPDLIKMLLDAIIGALDAHQLM